MTNARRVLRSVAVAMATAGLVFVSSTVPAAAATNTVTSVTGSAVGYHSFGITLFGGAQNDVGPTPTVSVASDGSNSPQSATATTGVVAYGPASLFTSDAIAVQTSGSLGTSGGVSTSSSVADINKATTQPGTGAEELTADNISSSCSATASGTPTGSTAVTNGTVATLSGNSDPNPPTVAPVPASPAANTTISGQIDLSATDTESFNFVFNEQTTDSSGNLTVNAVDEYFLGPTLKGNLVIGQVVCGTTVAPAADISLQNPGITHAPNTVAAGKQVMFTITVANLGPSDAAPVRGTTTVTGGKVAAVTTSLGTCAASKKPKGTVNCTFPTLASGQSATVVITVTAPRHAAGGAISVSSSASYSGDTNAANNTATDSVSVH